MGPHLANDIRYGMLSVNGSGAGRKLMDKTIEVDTLERKAYQAIRQLILQNELLPGAPIHIAEMAARLGVSKTPVREAFSKLAAEGLIVRQPHRTARVAELRESDVREVYRARRMLEPQIVRIVAHHTSTNPLLRERVQHLMRIANDILATPPARVLHDSVLDIDLGLNSLLLEVVSDTLLGDVLNTITERSLRIRTCLEKSGSARAVEVMLTETDEHLQIMIAILSGDGGLAHDASVLHLVGAERRALQHLEALEKRKDSAS